jgi:hypothetical protein
MDNTYPTTTKNVHKLCCYPVLASSNSSLTLDGFPFLRLGFLPRASEGWDIVYQDISFLIISVSLNSCMAFRIKFTLAIRLLNIS